MSRPRRVKIEATLTRVGDGWAIDIGGEQAGWAHTIGEASNFLKDLHYKATAYHRVEMPNGQPGFTTTLTKTKDD